MPPVSIFFIFLDGVGLGSPDPKINPLARANLPHLADLLEGRRLLSGAEPFTGPQASFRSVDATLGVDGVPESATGQAALLTGVNVPQIIGTHYGPKPDARIRAILQKHNLLRRLTGAGLRCRLLNAYPEFIFRSHPQRAKIAFRHPPSLRPGGNPLGHRAGFNSGRCDLGRFYRPRLANPFAVYRYAHSHPASGRAANGGAGAAI